MFVPFKTPVDYFVEVLKNNNNNIDCFKELLEQKKLNQPHWSSYDNDLHIYPYNKAIPAILSVGCPNQCPFCPTAQTHKGKIVFGNPEIIIPQYKDENLHFMDENFFYNDMHRILPLLKRQRITWLAMSDYKSTMEVLEEFGEDYLYECGLRIVEVGLENIALYKKVENYIPTKKIVICYLNMTCFPGETKESIAENREWMKSVSLKNPIHFNNGVWYACGQFLHPYKKTLETMGKVDGLLARTRPSWIPNSLLEQDYCIVNLETANFYSQLVYGQKMYAPKMCGNIGDFINARQRRATWMLSGLRVGAIK